jgi:RNA polymerase sigma factor (sigma-70 family)
MDGSALRRLETLFAAGSLGMLTDSQLMERAMCTRGGEGAQLAFATLVERHGPAVLRVCRAVLRDEHQAHDAFQATFLVLARKGRGLRVQGSLGAWLSQVALRVARGARAADARRCRLERRYAEIAAPEVAVDAADCEWELGVVVREEVDRLPDRLGVVVRLCDLGGCSHEEAARHLGWPVGTVKSRSARGRARLRARLVRRGLAPSVLPALARGPARLGPPAWLVEQTVRVTGHLVAGGPAGLVPVSIARLAEGAMLMMFVHRIQTFAGAALLLGLGAAGAIGMSAQSGKSPGASAPAAVAGRGESAKPPVEGVIAQDDPRIVRGPQTAVWIDAPNKLRADIEQWQTAVAAAQADRDHKEADLKVAQANFESAVATLAKLKHDLENVAPRLAGVAAEGATPQPGPGRWGVVTMDYDNDGNMDLLIADAAPSQGAGGPGSPAGGGLPPGHLLFKNLGNGKFQLVPLSPEAAPPGSQPAKPAVSPYVERLAPTTGETRRPSTEGAAVGSVNINAVFEKIERARQARQQLQADATREQESLERLQSRLRELDLRRNSKAPDGSDAGDLEAEIASLKRLFEEKREQATSEIARREARAVAVLDADIRSAIAEVARKQGLSYVVKVTPAPAADANTTDVQAVLNRSVLYADPRLDITEEVIRMLNDRYPPGPGPARPRE